MNYFLVKISIAKSNVSTKEAIKLVQATGHAQAAHYGIFVSAPNKKVLDWSENKVVDLITGARYSATTQKVPNEEIDVLKKYIDTVEANQSELECSGNYKEQWLSKKELGMNEFLIKLASLIEQYQATMAYTIDDDGIHIEVNGESVTVWLDTAPVEELRKLTNR